jgi:hypothetical protein
MKSSFLDGMVWGGAFCAALTAAVVSGYYKGNYEDLGYPSPIQKVYYKDTNLVAVAKSFLHKEYGYTKFRALRYNHCYDQLLDKMLMRSDWKDPVCYDQFNYIVQEFRGFTYEKR